MTTVTLEIQKKLPEGWHNTEKYGEVFVSPGGTAWVVKEMPNHELKSVAVPMTPQDIIKTSAIDRVKRALVQRRRYKARLSVRKSPPCGLSEVKGNTQGIAEGTK